MRGFDPHGRGSHPRGTIGGGDATADIAGLEPVSCGFESRPPHHLRRQMVHGGMLAFVPRGRGSNSRGIIGGGDATADIAGLKPVSCGFESRPPHHVADRSTDEILDCSPGDRICRPF